MTVLRHPVDRTLSFLRHQAERRQRGATEDTPLVEIYEDPFRFRHMIQNHMVRTLSLSPEEMLRRRCADPGPLHAGPAGAGEGGPRRPRPLRAAGPVRGVLRRALGATGSTSARRCGPTRPRAGRSPTAWPTASPRTTPSTWSCTTTPAASTRPAAQARPSEQLDVAEGQGPVVGAPAGRRRAVAAATSGSAPAGGADEPVAAHRRPAEPHDVVGARCVPIDRTSARRAPGSPAGARTSHSALQGRPPPPRKIATPLRTSSPSVTARYARGPKP